MQVIPKSSFCTQAETLVRRACEFKASGDTANFRVFCDSAFDCAPEDHIILNRLGTIYLTESNYEEAARYFERATLLNNNVLNYHYNFGVCLKELKLFSKSLQIHKNAIKQFGNNIQSLNEIGLIYIKLQELSEAESTFLKALSLNSKDLTTCTNLAHFNFIKRDLRKAIDFANQAIEIGPDQPEAYLTLARALFTANFHEQAIENYKKAIDKGIKDSANAQQSILMLMLYSDNFTPEEILAEHKKWAYQNSDSNLAIEHFEMPQIQKSIPINIGFVSGNFRKHSISGFLLPLLKNLNPQRFQVHCYASVEDPDEVTEQFKALSAAWRDITHESDDHVSQIIKQDNIHILIDLAGHSMGTRIDLFSKKPAPLQFSYLGYAFSSGLDSMDFKIVNDYTDPINKSEHLYTEKLARLNPSFLCFQPDKEIPLSPNLPVKMNGHITFGSFNNFSKLSPSTIQAWSNILTTVPDSKIILKNNQPIPDLLRDNILSRFEHFGISHQRVLMHHPIEDQVEHMSYYNNVDICLDTFPYNGTTTTFEAIYMGVPVIVLAGNTHHSRVGQSILKNLAIDDLISGSIDQYILITKALANNIEHLTLYRKSLRQKLLSSSLTDAEGFTKNFESLLQKAWIRAHAN